jgi:hypothetical protein
VHWEGIFFARTVDDGTDDGVDLAILCGLGALESLLQRLCESWTSLFSEKLG